jgi:uncharacterized membrane protein
MAHAETTLARPSGEGWRRLAGALQIAFTLAYPLIVWLAFTKLETRAVGVLLLSLYLVSSWLRARGSLADLRSVARQHAPLVGLVLLAVATGAGTVLLLVPVVVSLYLLWTFAASLRAGPSMVERFARIVEEDLPDFCVPYCRKVTMVWCAFMAANALCAGLLAFLAPIEWWALYAGLVFYVLMGALLAGEFVVRKLWFRHYGDGALDRGFRWLFPPERTANGRRSLAYAQARRSRASRPSA